METEYSNQLIEWISSRFSCAAFLNYEQILPNDPFGRTMVENLRVIILSNILSYLYLSITCYIARIVNKKLNSFFLSIVVIIVFSYLFIQLHSTTTK